jgi:hypothetical protein
MRHGTDFRFVEVFPYPIDPLVASCGPCTEIQAGCQQSETMCVASALACASASPGFYLIQGVVVACTLQNGCAISGATCLTNTTLLACETAGAGFFLQSGVAISCTVQPAQQGCTVSGSFCLANGQRSCVSAAAGYYVNGTGWSAKCTPQTSGCARSSDTICTKVGSVEGLLVCLEAEPGFYVQVSSGAAQPCTVQLGCADSSQLVRANKTCLASGNTTQLLCHTASELGFTIEQGVVTGAQRHTHDSLHSLPTHSTHISLSQCDPA